MLFWNLCDLSLQRGPWIHVAVRVWETPEWWIVFLSQTFVFAFPLILANQLSEAHPTSHRIAMLVIWTPKRVDPPSCLTRTRGESERPHMLCCLLKSRLVWGKQFFSHTMCFVWHRVMASRWVTFLAAATMVVAWWKWLAVYYAD